MHSDQRAFIPGRLIGDNLLEIHAILSLLQDSNEDLLFVSVDFEKAFDSVDWKFLYVVLNVMGFPQSFIGWIKANYNDPYACIINNSYLSSFFPLQKSLPQGSPLSPLLFILCIEILVIHIRQAENIKGVHFKDLTKKLNLFADDALFFVKNDHNSMQNLCDLLQKFALISNLRVNYDKSVITPYRFGMDVQFLNLGRPFSSSKSRFKYLGIEVYVVPPGFEEDPMATQNI